MEQETEFQFEYAESSDVGCVRELNEDSIYSQSGMWVVADGMGGHACGEVASAMAVEEVVEYYKEFALLDDAIQSAHLDIKEAGELETRGKLGMGTTVVAMVADKLNYKIAWVGDSRAYLWDGVSGNLMQISRDHSLMTRLIDSGLITAKDAMTHPQRHLITQCVGSVEVELLKVDMIDREWDYKQQVLLCSDGLTDEVTEEQISEIMAADLSNSEKVAELIDKAKQAGGRDNISVIIIDSPIKESLSFLQKIVQHFKARFKRS